MVPKVAAAPPAPQGELRLLKLLITAVFPQQGRAGPAGSRKILTPRRSGKKKEAKPDPKAVCKLSPTANERGGGDGACRCFQRRLRRELRLLRRSQHGYSQKYKKPPQKNKTTPLG